MAKKEDNYKQIRNHRTYVKCPKCKAQMWSDKKTLTCNSCGTTKSIGDVNNG